MKKIYLLLAFILCINYSWSQEYSRMINAGTYTVEQIQQEAEAYFAIRGTGKGTGYKNYKRWEYHAQRALKDNGVLKPISHYYNELERYNNELNQNSEATNADIGSWEQLGPLSFTTSSSSTGALGRLKALAVEKGNANHVIVGSETGGVWKSLDAGTTWTPLTDNLSNILVESLTINPLNPSIYFWGSRNGVIFKSTDAGATWNILATVGNGLVNKIMVDPSNQQKMYCSVENSGIYKSTNGGTTWTAIGGGLIRGYDIEFKPGDPNTVYASGDKFLRSNDGGATFVENSPAIPNWELEYIPAATNPENIIWEIAARNWDRFGITPVFPKTGAGLGRFISNNGGSSYAHGNKTKFISVAMDITSGTTPELKFSHAQPEFFGDVDRLKVFYRISPTDPWVELASYQTNVQAWADVTLALPNPSATYQIAFEGETSGGGNVLLDDISVVTSLGTILTEGFEGSSSNVFGTGAKMIAVSEINPSIVYVVESSSPSTQSAFFGAFYKSTDAGVNLNKQLLTKNYFGGEYDGSGTGGQAPFHMAIAASNTDANVVIIGGVNTWRTTDGGVTFDIASHWIKTQSTSNNKGFSHADTCTLQAIDGKIYVGSDGGFFVADNPSAVMSATFYTDKSAGLGIRQFYKFGISQTNPVIITGGAQDNGTSGRTTDGTWYNWDGGDGAEGFVDKNDSSILYGQSQNGNISKTTDVTSSSGKVGITDAPGGNGSFIAPLEQDPTAPNVYYSGKRNLYRTANDGANWTAISQDFGSNINEFKIAQSDNNTIYAAINSNQLFKTTTGSGTWTQLNNFTGGFINSIAIHPTNPNKVAIASTGSEKVYVTIDGGTTWTSHKFNLPDFSALAVTWDNNGNDGLYVGMDYGIFYIDNTENVWKPFSNNLPNVKISELEINYVDNKLYTATYGRGVWRSGRFNTSTLDVEQFEALNTITLFPNPAKNEVNITWDQNENVTIKIFNSTGKLLHYAKDVSINNSLKIDTSQFSTGLYFVRLNTNESVVTKKLIIQ
ncbi:Dispase autolysis-inducing protein [Kordia antarctica]|uniref:Dispase autolysis-inducing protein n=1 Tax=Kordia antarctica TaxID=1218801 RepID=A0A7L4ZEQ7_9FLAO|nr:T9SS type A sorting domain-containing protein [Kordia antarctica]QHI34990.1 Dispase autolysis-inducing protein [Kordia antarctica]